MIQGPYPVILRSYTIAVGRYDFVMFRLLNFGCFVARYFQTKLNEIQPSILLPMFNTLTQSLFKGMPQSAAGSSLIMSKHAERASLVRAQGPAGVTKQDERLLRDMPKDIRTIYKIFDLDPEVTAFATCPQPKCCATYMPTLDKISGIKHYPPRCTREKFGKICGSALVKERVSHGLSVPSPLRPFTYHHFNGHVASMLSQPGIEDEIYTHMHSGALDRELRDIINSPTLTQLRDPMGLPFLRDCGTEIRLVWALCVDWYNPRMNKASGKSVSTGVISMICLSLPPHLRLREGLIYDGGTIPGPQEPAVDAINEFLDPLTNDMRVSYDPGVYFSQTHKYPNGRVARSAVVPVISDTLASKKVTGHCGHRGKYFCSRCRLPRFDIDNLDMATWPPGLTRCEHEQLAGDWLKASTMAKQNALVTSQGIRWSALLKLSYWQPSWIITEGLHVLFLNVIPRHCRDLLGLNLKGLQDEDNVEIPPETMEQAMKILARRSKSSLKSLPMNILKALCLEQHVTVPPPAKGRRKKSEYISALLVSTMIVTASHILIGCSSNNRDSPHLSSQSIITLLTSSTMRSISRSARSSPVTARILNPLLPHQSSPSLLSPSRLSSRSGKVLLPPLDLPGKPLFL
jgi:hypothetical protein